MTQSRLLFTILLFQVMFVPTSQATDVSINGSENLTLMDEIIFDYSDSPNVIEFDIVNPFVCTRPVNNPNPTTILNVSSVLDGNNVLAANLDHANNVFNVSTIGSIQCASQLGIYNDTIYNGGFESSGNNIQIVLKDLATGAILNSASNIELHDGQEYQYKYEIRNTSPASLSIDFVENYLRLVAPTFVDDAIDEWQCSIVSGLSSCGIENSGNGYVELTNAVVSAFGQLDVVVTRRVSVDRVGPAHKLDLLAAAFLNNNVSDSNLNNNVSFTSFGTTTITATQLNVTSQPNNAVAGNSISSITVEMLDADGILDANNSGLVNLSVSQSSPSGANLSGTVQRAAVNGIATFPGLSIDKAGTGYSLTASSFGLSGTTTNTFNISPAAATRLEVVSQPTDTVAQNVISPVVVHALDNFGNIDTSYSSRVFANIKSGAGNLSGTTNPFANSGVASFSNLLIDVAGNGYTLLISSGALQSDISDAFNITAISSASNSTFGVNAGNQTAGTNVTYSAVIKDVNNNAVGAGVAVSFGMLNSAGSNVQNVQCVTTSNGTCSVAATSTLVGVTDVSASINVGTINSVTSGLTDSTTWVPGDANASLSNFGVSNATANTNSSVVLEAELKDQFGNLVPDVSVTFQLIDSLSSTPSSTLCGQDTDNNGVCSGSVSSSQTGTTTIKAFYGFPSVEITNSNNYNGLGKVVTWQ